MKFGTQDRAALRALDPEFEISAGGETASIAGEIETRLREDLGARPAAIDGFPTSQWIVLDYLQVIVHVFHQEKRDFYSLEDLWSDAPRLTLAGIS